MSERRLAGKRHMKYLFMGNLLYGIESCTRRKEIEQERWLYYDICDAEMVSWCNNKIKLSRIFWNVAFEHLLRFLSDGVSYRLIVCVCVCVRNGGSAYVTHCQCYLSPEQQIISKQRQRECTQQKTKTILFSSGFRTIWLCGI